MITLSYSSQNCIHACMACADECRNCAQLWKRVIPFEDACLSCARQCEYLVGLLLHNSEISFSEFEECAEICSECALMCEKYNHPSCLNCGNICRECEELCYIMAEKSINYFQTSTNYESFTNLRITNSIWV